jgi:hypothetical protein
MAESDGAEDGGAFDTVIGAAFDALEQVSTAVHGWLGVEEGENFWIDGTIIVVGGFLAFWLFMVVAIAAIGVIGALLAFLWPFALGAAILYFILGAFQDD